MSTGKRQLVEVVSALRSDIEAAIEASHGQGLKFELQGVEIDLQTKISKTGDVNINGGVEFNILGYEFGKVGGEIKGHYSKQDSHTIRLKLKPKRWNEKTQSYDGIDMSDLD